MLSFANDGDHDNNMHDEPSLNCDEHGSKDGWFVSQKRGFGRGKGKNYLSVPP